MALIEDSVRAARLQQDAAAEQRFRASAAERSGNTQTRLSPGAGASTDLLRLTARANRLASSDPRLADEVRLAAEATPAEQQLRLERIIDVSQLQAATFLPRGARAARSVARISTVHDGRQVAIGTGFLVSPMLVMTNHHVLPIALAARHAVAEFEVELDIDGRPQAEVPFALDASRFFFTDPDLDVTVVSVAAVTPPPGETYGWAQLQTEQDGIVLGEELNIVGHPSGRLKEIAIRDNRLVAVLPTLFQYTTDTETGSSGSPVFNNSWEVVALHHAGVPARDDEGHRLRVDGTVAGPGDDDDAIRWEANEGIRIGAVLDALGRLELERGSVPAALRDEVLAPRPRAAPLAVRPPPGPSSAGADDLESLPGTAAVGSLSGALDELELALARARRALADARPRDVVT